MTSKPIDIATGICAGSNVTNRTGSGRSVCHGEVNGVGEAKRLFAHRHSGRGRGRRWSTGTTATRSHDSRTRSSRSIAAPALRWTRINEHERLHQRQAAAAPIRVGLQCLQHHGACCTVEMQTHKGTGVEIDGHPRISRSSRSTRTLAHVDTVPRPSVHRIVAGRSMHPKPPAMRDVRRPAAHRSSPAV